MTELSPKFLDQVIKSIQSSCLAHIEFSYNVQIIGHLYICIDDIQKENIIINETVLKDDEETSITFKSDSFAASPQVKPSSRKLNQHVRERQPYSSRAGVSELHSEGYTQDSVVPSRLSPICPRRNSMSDNSMSPTRSESSVPGTLTRFDTCSLNQRTNLPRDQPALVLTEHSEVPERTCEPPQKRRRWSESRDVNFSDSSSQNVVKQLHHRQGEQNSITDSATSRMSSQNQNSEMPAHQSVDTFSEELVLKQTIKEEPPDDDYPSTSNVMTESPVDNINSGTNRIAAQTIGLVPVSLTKVSTDMAQSIKGISNTVSLSQSDIMNSAQNSQPVIFSAAQFGHQVIDTTGQRQHQEIRLLDLRDLGHVSCMASSNPEYIAVENNLEGAAIDSTPPETPATPTSTRYVAKRFKTVSTEELQEYESLHQSKATKKNTKWGVNILKDWHQEVFQEELQLDFIPVEELAEKLTKFYCEAKPKDVGKRATAMPEVQAEEYTKNTLKNIRAAINRYFQNSDREIDIVHDMAFRKANKSLDGMLKSRLQAGILIPTKPKEIIISDDFQKIVKYFDGAIHSPIKLRQCVWYNIAVHFQTKGLEFHFQLFRNAFEFKIDENNIEYAALTSETQRKLIQGGLHAKEAAMDKRMYADGSGNCPVANLKFFLSKTDQNATSLFNQCKKDALVDPSHNILWYASKSLGKSSFNNFMPDISQYAECSKRYTVHCLRTTILHSMKEKSSDA